MSAPREPQWVLALAQTVPAAFDAVVVRLALAGALGLFLGLEREWSHKPAGIRTFALISLLGAVFTVLAVPGLLVVGGVLVVLQGLVLALDGLFDRERGLSMTTSVSMLVAYGVGVLVGSGYVLEGVTVAVLSSLLLVLKRELHSFAWGLSREELQSATEFAILAFVVYPLLPTGPVTVGQGRLAVSLEPRVIWLMVVTVAGIGIVNYAIVQTYGGRGVAITGFFGGLASSTAVVGTMLDHVQQRPSASTYAIAAVLLADAAMALRNLVIALVFTLQHGILLDAVIPLGAVIVGSGLVAAHIADWSVAVELDLQSPFSLGRALVFGAVFLLVVVTGGVASSLFGTAGFYVASAISGLVSSAGATTSAVLLYRSGSLAASEAVLAILLATGASVLVKAGLTLASPNRRFGLRVTGWSVALLVGATLVTLAVTV
jgi:uncharacterized membrane protein (DUF4010 family)